MATRRRRWPQGCRAGGCWARPARRARGAAGAGRRGGRLGRRRRRSRRRSPGRRRSSSRSRPADGGDPALAAATGAALAQARARWVGYLSTTGGLWRPAGRLGGRDQRARAGDRARALAGGGGGGLAGERAAGADLPAGRASTGRGGARSTGCARGGRSGWSSRGRSSAASTSTTSPRRSLASMARPDPGRAYNVADDEPAPPQDVIAFAAELLGLPVPPEVPFEAAELSPMARSFYGESKRVANRRIKAGARGPARLSRLSRRPSRPSSRPAAEGPAQQRGRNLTPIRFPHWQSRRHDRPKIPASRG